jgi:predicted transcriptional regulator
MKLETEIKLRVPQDLKDQLNAIAARKRRRPSDLLREHLWALVDSEKPKPGEQFPLFEEAARR